MSFQSRPELVESPTVNVRYGCQSRHTDTSNGVTGSSALHGDEACAWDNDVDTFLVWRGAVQLCGLQAPPLSRSRPPAGSACSRTIQYEHLRVPPYSVRRPYRWADGRLERLPVLATELVASNVDVLIALGPASWAAKRATSTVPIVMAFSGDPVGNGVVSNLARPGG